jgi:hypothetical protein
MFPSDEYLSRSYLLFNQEEAWRREFLHSTDGRGNGRRMETECHLKDLQCIGRAVKTTRGKAD